MCKCRICGSLENVRIGLKATMYGTKGSFPYFMCKNCGCLQIEKIPDNMDSYYDTNQYYSFNMEKRNLKNELLFRQLKNQIGKKDILGWMVEKLYPVDYRFVRYLKRNDKLLDIGCGDGEFLRWLKRLGYQNVLGLDPYLPQDVYDEKGLFIINAELTKYQFNQKYEMITMIHSLEHIYDQFETMKAIDAILVKNGYLVIQLPFFSEYYWGKYGNNLYTLDPPRHYYIHTYKSMMELIHSVGYKLVDFGTEIDVAIPEMSKNIEHDQTEKNTGTNIIKGTIEALTSKKLRKELKQKEDGAIATFVFQKI